MFAVVTAAFAFLAYRKQTQEVGILIDQNREHQQTLEREARERRGAQASRVFISLENPGERSDRINVTNTSEQPVYNVKIQWIAPGDVHSSQPGTILPGDRVTFEGLGVSGPFKGDEPFAVLTFRDAAGVTWERLLNGDLREITPKSEAPSLRSD